MPSSFTAQTVQYQAKCSVVSDGETFTSAAGTAITSALSSRSVFLANPIRSATGVWSITIKDPVFVVTDIGIQTVLATAYLSVQLRPQTKDSSGRTVLNWTLNSAGTPTDLPAGGMMIISVSYGETSA